MVDFNSLSYLGKVIYVLSCFSVAVATIGIISNALTFCVYMRKRLRKYSFSLYIKVMSITDSLTLLANYRHWAAFVLDANLDLVSPFFCAVDEYQPYVVAIITLWLLSLISFDRFITIAFPNRLSLLKNTYFQVSLILCTVFYGLLSFIYMPINYKIVSFGNPNFTVIQLCVIDISYLQITSWINLSNLVVVNLLLNNILNVLMIVVLFRSRSRMSQFSSRNNERKDRKFAINAIGLNVTSTLFKLPLSIVFIVSNVSTQLTFFDILLLFNITVLIANVYSSASFFLNICINSVFYHEFLVMVRLRKANRVSWTMPTTRDINSTQNSNKTK
jgi:hypothetical protein